MRTAVALAPMTFSPYLGCGFREKDAEPGAGRLSRVRCSPTRVRLSIEMNAKTAAPPDVAIEFRGVTYYINDIPARAIVRDVSLTISRGETLVLLGRSGSGKTTLLKLINRMLTPSEGQVF